MSTAPVLVPATTTTRPPGDKRDRPGLPLYNPDLPHRTNLVARVLWCYRLHEGPRAGWTKLTREELHRKLVTKWREPVSFAAFRRGLEELDAKGFLVHWSAQRSPGRRREVSRGRFRALDAGKWEASAQNARIQRFRSKNEPKRTSELKAEARTLKAAHRERHPLPEVSRSAPPCEPKRTPKVSRFASHTLEAIPPEATIEKQGGESEGVATGYRGAQDPPPAPSRRFDARKTVAELEASARTWAGEELPRWPNREGTIRKCLEAGATLEDLRDAVLGALVTRAREWDRRRDFWAGRDGGADPLVIAAGSGFESYRELGAQEREAEELERQEREKAERRESDRCRECEAGGHELGERRDRGKGRWWAQCRCGKRATANDPGLREDLRLFGKLVDEPETPAQAQAQAEAPEPSEAAWDELAERYDRERQARSIGPPPEARQKLVELGVLQ